MLLCMRTTIELNDSLLKEAKKRATEEGVSLKALVERALRSLLTPRQPKLAYKLAWHAERGQLLPGVRLEDRDALFDLMDGRR